MVVPSFGVKMNIIVIGAGAMGSIYGGRLSAGNTVTLVDTNEALIEKVSKDGVILEEGGVEKCFHPAIDRNADKAGKADLVILFTKSLYSKSALENVRGAIGPDTYLTVPSKGRPQKEQYLEFLAIFPSHYPIDDAVIERGLGVHIAITENILGDLFLAPSCVL